MKVFALLLLVGYVTAVPVADFLKNLPGLTKYIYSRDAKKSLLNPIKYPILPILPYIKKQAEEQDLVSFGGSNPFGSTIVSKKDAPEEDIVSLGGSNPFGINNPFIISKKDAPEEDIVSLGGSNPFGINNPFIISKKDAPEEDIVSLGGSNPFGINNPFIISKKDAPNQ